MPVLFHSHELTSLLAISNSSEINLWGAYISQVPRDAKINASASFSRQFIRLICFPSSTGIQLAQVARTLLKSLPHGDTSCQLSRRETKHVNRTTNDHVPASLISASRKKTSTNLIDLAHSSASAIWRVCEQRCYSNTWYPMSIAPDCYRWLEEREIRYWQHRTLIVTRRTRGYLVVNILHLRSTTRNSVDT